MSKDSEKTLDNDAESVSTVDYEAKAVELGWTPLDKFRGDPEKFVDAKTFYEKAEHVLPIVKKQRDESRAEAAQSKQAIVELKKEVETIRSDAKEAISFMRAGIEREYQTKIDALKEAKAVAVSEGDGAAVNRIDDQIDELKDKKKEEKAKVSETVTAETPQLHPGFLKWVDDNKWYATDPKLKKKADALGQSYAEDDGLTGPDLWEAVKADIVKLFPDKFEDVTERIGAVRGGKTSASNSNARTFANLPADAQAACNKFIKQGLVKNEAQYLQNYDWE
jgi:hypothetical protein